MEFKLLFKNYTTPNVRYGYVETENLSCELDSAQVVITNVDEINIEPYDMVEFTDAYNVKKYYLVASYTKQYVNYVSPYKFDYTVALMSLTKLLEVIILPSMTITNIGKNRTIGYYIEKVANNYFKFDGMALTGIDIPSSLSNKVAPEITLTNPTLREYLDNLYSVCGMMCKLTYDNGFILSYIDLNAREDVISTEYLDTMETGANATNYVSNLVGNVENAIAQQTFRELVDMRCNDYALTTDNAKIILSHNIYDLKKVIFKCNLPYKMWYVENDVTDWITGTRMFEIDITEYVVPKEIYSTLELNTSYDISNVDRYKNNCVYFERGSNWIDGLLDYDSNGASWIFNSTSDLRIAYAVFSAFNNMDKTDLLEEIASENGVDNCTRVDLVGMGTYGSTWRQNIGDDEYGYKQWCFIVEYLAYIDTRIRYTQTLPYTHDVSASSNTTDSSVDLDKFGKYCIDTVNQLGNDELGFTANCPLTYQYQLGQTFNDYVLIKLEKSVYDNKTLFKGIMSQHFTQKNIYTNIDRTKRYTALQNSNIVRRSEIYVQNVYLNVGGNPVSNLLINRLLTMVATYAVINTMVGYTCCYPVMTTTNNTITYSCALETNTHNGLIRGNVDGNYQLMEYVKYVDENGECPRGVKMFLYETNKYDDIDFVNTFPKFNSYTEGLNQLGSFEYPILKDSREALTLNAQYTFTSSKAIIGEGFSNAVLHSSDTLYWMKTDKSYAEHVNEDMSYYSDEADGTLTMYQLASNKTFNKSGNVVVFDILGRIIFYIKNYVANTKIWLGTDKEATDVVNGYCKPQIVVNKVYREYEQDENGEWQYTTKADITIKNNNGCTVLYATSQSHETLSLPPHISEIVRRTRQIEALDSKTIVTVNLDQNYCIGFFANVGLDATYTLISYDYFYIDSTGSDHVDEKDSGLLTSEDITVYRVYDGYSITAQKVYVIPSYATIDEDSISCSCALLDTSYEIMPDADGDGNTYLFVNFSGEMASPKFTKFKYNVSYRYYYND